MENKCEKCFYYIEETEITNTSKIWNSEETCEDFIEDEESDKINVNSTNIEGKTTLNN